MRMIIINKKTESYMNGTTELDLWNLLQITNMANGIQFLGIAFLAWVGMRISSSIYNSGDSNMVVKIAGTVFCLIVAYFMLFNFGLGAWNIAGSAAAMASLAEPLTPTAENFVAFAEMNSSSEGFSIIPNLAQGLLVLSILVIQLGGIWMAKK